MSALFNRWQWWHLVLWVQELGQTEAFHELPLTKVLEYQWYGKLAMSLQVDAFGVRV